MPGIQLARGELPAVAVCSHGSGNTLPGVSSICMRARGQEDRNGQRPDAPNNECPLCPLRRGGPFPTVQRYRSKRGGAAPGPIRVDDDWLGRAREGSSRYGTPGSRGGKSNIGHWRCSGAAVVERGDGTGIASNLTPLSIYALSPPLPSSCAASACARRHGLVACDAAPYAPRPYGLDCLGYMPIDEAKRVQGGQARSGISKSIPRNIRVGTVGRGRRLGLLSHVPGIRDSRAYTEVRRIPVKIERLAR